MTFAFGDRVIIQKAGDVIPEVVGVNKQKRDETEKIFEMPKVCPVCGAEAVREEGEAVVRCIGIECPAKLYRSIIHFASKDAMNIDGLGENIIAELIERNLISNIADIYKLTFEDIASLKKNGKKFAQNMIDAIEESTANTISEFFMQDQTRDLLQKLYEAGVNMQVLENQESDQRFAGKVFVLTGSLENYTRDEASQIIEKYGGKTSSSVSKKTDYVLAGEEAGSKLKKAQELGINIISEEEFKQMTQ